VNTDQRTAARLHRGAEAAKGHVDVLLDSLNELNDQDLATLTVPLQIGGNGGFPCAPDGVEPRRPGWRCYAARPRRRASGSVCASGRGWARGREPRSGAATEQRRRRRPMSRPLAIESTNQATIASARSVTQCDVAV
jgi:hypothetical protein